MVKVSHDGMTLTQTLGQLLTELLEQPLLCADMLRASHWLCWWSLGSMGKGEGMFLCAGGTIYWRRAQNSNGLTS